MFPMLSRCVDACMNKNVRSSLHCIHSYAGTDGPHGPHDWFNFIHNQWLHCCGSEEED